MMGPTVAKSLVLVEGGTVVDLSVRFLRRHRLRSPSLIH
jgi:hypothetical protein